MRNRQFDLFAANRTDDLPQHGGCFDLQQWFLEPHPPEWREREYERALEFVRASLPAILEQSRAAETFPWFPEDFPALRIIFHNRSSWLPPDECKAFRQAFRDELARWEEAGQLPVHDPADPAFLTRRTVPPALDCPAAEWEVAGLPPIFDETWGRYNITTPLPLDQDTYVLWPSVFKPRAAAPPPPGEAVAENGE